MANERGCESWVRIHDNEWVGFVVEIKELEQFAACAVCSGTTGSGGI